MSKVAKQLRGRPLICQQSYSALSRVILMGFLEMEFMKGQGILQFNRKNIFKDGVRVQGHPACTQPQGFTHSTESIIKRK